MKQLENYKYRYALEKGSKKYKCPECHKRTFVRYIDNETKSYLPDQYGRCDREIKCGYFNNYIPNQENVMVTSRRVSTEVLKLDNYHDYKLVNDSIKESSSNQFIKYLNLLFGKKTGQKIVNRYKIGTAPYWYNGTVFWQIDQNDNVHGGKIIKYNSEGKRFDTPYWVHSYLKRENKIEQFNLGQCLFGLQLIKENEYPIALVESEKTACIMSEVYSNFRWLATGSLMELKKKKLLPIKNRKIILYPDSGLSDQNKTPFNIWSQKCNELNLEGFDIEISDLIERETTKEQKGEGYDIADFFMK